MKDSFKKLAETLREGDDPFPKDVQIEGSFDLVDAHLDVIAAAHHSAYHSHHYSCPGM